MSGMIVEKAIIKKDEMVKLPNNIDYAMAAALLNAVMGFNNGITFRGGICRKKKLF